MLLEDGSEAPVVGPQEVAVVSTTATNCQKWQKPAFRTTATNSHGCEKPPFFDPFPEVICDWLSGVHYLRHQVEPRNSGRVMKISAEGEIEWESQSWETVHCASSDTSLRVKCDGVKLWFSGNVGRFQESDNRCGLTVTQCVDKWRRVLDRMGFPVSEFGTVFRVMPDAGAIATRAWLDNDVAWRGTRLSRVDLAGNFWTSDYPMLCHALSVRKIGQASPILGRYGPTWGYGKRSGWWKAKVYDKDAEQSGKRRTSAGATTARFEVQLGGEWLRRNGCDTGESWAIGNGGVEMGQVIWGRFAEQGFRDTMCASSWAEGMPARLIGYAATWREGKDLRSVVPERTYYRVRRELLAYGIDVSLPCNVVALTRPAQEVAVQWLPALRRTG